MVDVVDAGNDSLKMVATCVGKMLQGDGKGNRAEIVNFAFNGNLDDFHQSFSVIVPEGGAEAFKILCEYDILFTLKR